MRVHPPGDGESGWRVRLMAAALVALVAAVYANSLDAGFHLDDVNNIVDNEAIRVSSLDLDGLYRAATESPINHPRPLAYLSFALNYLVGGLDVRGYHLANIAIHALTTLGLFLAARLLVSSTAGWSRRAATEAAFVCAALWCVHPLQVQAVTYIVQRMASMAAMFAVWGVVALLCVRSARRGVRLWGWAAAGLCFAFGLLTKLTVIGILPAIVVYGVLAARLPHARLVLASTAALAGVAATLAPRLAPGMTAPGSLIHNLVSLSLDDACTVSRAIWRLLGLAVLPLPRLLNIDHDLVLSTGITQPRTSLPALIGLLALLALPFATWRRYPLATLGLVWFGVPTVLEHVVVREDPIFEHRFYLPSMGLFLVLGAAARRSVERWPAHRGLLGATLLGLLVALSAGTVLRNRVWATELSLWGDAAAKSPQKVRARGLWVGALYDAGQRVEAEAAYESLKTMDARDFRDPRGQAIAATRLGHLEDAKAFLDRSLELSPGNCSTLLLRAKVDLQLGDAVEATEDVRLVRRYCGSIVSYDRELRPVEDSLARTWQTGASVESPASLFGRAVWLASQERYEEALAIYELLVERGQVTSSVWTNLAYCHMDLGRDDEARAAFARALALDEGDTAALYGLGLVEARQGNVEAARSAFEAYLSHAAASDPYRAAAEHRLEILAKP